jgi:hypothetical protein
MEIPDDICVHMTGRESPLRWTAVTVHSPDEAVTRAACEIIEMNVSFALRY